MTDCRLFLLTPRLTLPEADRFHDLFAEAAKAGGAASALLRLAPGAAGDLKRIVAPLLDIAIAAECALLIEGDPRMAARLGVDGVHLSGAGADLSAAVESLQPERIVGVGLLKGRDDAMTAGEAGADYVMFGEPRVDGWTPPFEETLERIGWWADIFETPCVGYAETIEAAAELAAAGADFVALGDAIWSSPSPAEAAAKAAARLASAKRLGTVG